MAADGANVAGWGNITALCGSSAVACSQTWLVGTSIVETDQEFSTGYSWCNGSCTNDVQSIAAHETGHGIGFGHVNDSTNVMYPTVQSGTSNRQLGKGDALEADAKY